MSDENVRLVREHYEAFSRGDLETLIEGLAPEVEFSGGDPLAASELGTTIRGREQARVYFEGLMAMLTNREVEIRSVEADGDLVAATVYLHGTWSDSGLHAEMHAVHAFTVRDGRIAANRVYRQTPGQD